MKIVLVGQKKFGLEVLKLCEAAGLTIGLVVAPLDDLALAPYAEAKGYKMVPAGMLSSDHVKGFDLGVMAHSFHIIGKALRETLRIGWLGYHPSLLPRHRGKSAIDWALRMKDVITGGTIYWLNDRIDDGDIAYQDWIWLDHSKTAKQVWDEELMPMGLRLYGRAIMDVKANIILRRSQAPLGKFATYERPIDNLKVL